MMVKVINYLGEEWTVDVYPELTVDQLKQMALVHFFHPLSCIKTSDQFKLISVNKGSRLTDECALRDENIQENEELLLMKRRMPSKKSEETTEEKNQKLHGPTNIEIQFATVNISQKNVDRVIEDNPVVIDEKFCWARELCKLKKMNIKFFHNFLNEYKKDEEIKLKNCTIVITSFHQELRKILVSLVQASEKLLRYHPDVMDILQDTSVNTEDDVPSYINQDALKQLLDMGFSKEKAIIALEINKMSPIEATDWLLAHEDESASSTASEYGPHSSHESNRSNLDCPVTPEPCHLNRVATILNHFRQYKRKEFRPNLKALNSLKEMGFSEEEVLDALRIHSNNQDAACEWLLNDRRPLTEDLDNGLDPEGPMYKAIMSNAIVQLGLNSPKTFFALLQMLENLNSASRWLNDSDTAPLLSQIFRIYHAEKHSLQMMRSFSR